MQGQDSRVTLQAAFNTALKQHDDALIAYDRALHRGAPDSQLVDLDTACAAAYAGLQQAALAIGVQPP